MRVAILLTLTLASLACASAPTPSESPRSNDGAQPAEVEGSAPKVESAAQPSDEGLYTLGSLAESPCEGQRVRVRGRAAERVMQHPIVALPQGMSPDGRNTEQGYMDVGETQIIVLTSAPFHCRGSMSVVGTLECLDLGGDGTDRKGKNSYSGWMIKDAVVTCE